MSNEILVIDLYNRTAFAQCQRDPFAIYQADFRIQYSFDVIHIYQITSVTPDKTCAVQCLFDGIQGKVRLISLIGGVDETFPSDTLNISNFPNRYME